MLTLPPEPDRAGAPTTSRGNASRIAATLARLGFAAAIPLAQLSLPAQDAELELDVAALSLDELLSVEVNTPGKVPERIRDAAASVRLVDRSEIESEGYATLTEVFESVPGLYNIYNYDGVSGNFGVRGFWNARSQNSSVAILVNGVPQTRMDNWSHPLDMLSLPVEAIDRIEVVRGPNAVIYGNGASFGAINIITDESYFDDQAGIAFGGRGTRRAFGRASEFGKDWRVIANVGYYATDGLEPRLADMVSPEMLPALAEYNVTDPDATLEGQLEQDLRHAQVSAGWRRAYLEATANDTKAEFFPGVPGVADGSMRDVASRRITLGVDGIDAGPVAIDAWLSFGDHKIELDYDGFIPEFVGYNDLTYNSWEAEALVSYEPAPDASLIAGVNWQRVSDLDEITHIPLLGVNNEAVIIDRSDTRSLFAQYSGKFAERWRAVAGFRVEQRQPFTRLGYHNIEEDEQPTFGGRYEEIVNVTPRVSLIYQPSDSSVLKIMAGEATKLPNVPDSRTFDSETARTLEINYTRAGEKALFEASVFRNTLDKLLIDELRFLPDGSVDTAAVQGGKIETTGLELLGRLDLAESWRAELGATWQESEDARAPGREVSYSPEVVAHAKVVYSIDGFSAALLGRYVDSMKPYFDVAADDGAGAYLGEMIDGYAVFDFNLRWEDLFAEGFFAGLRVSNLFDTEIRYPNNPLNTALFDRGLIGEGRRAMLTVGYKF